MNTKVNTTIALIEDGNVMLSPQQTAALIQLFHSAPLSFVDAARDFLRVAGDEPANTDNPLVAALINTGACDGMSAEQLEAAADVVFGMAALAALTYTRDNADDDTPLYGTFVDYADAADRDPACGNCHECEDGCKKPN